MAIKTSTGLRNKMLDANPLKTIMASGFIKIYAGTPPTTADDAIGGGNTLLCTISNNSTGTGITFAASASGGAIAKNGSEVWSGVNSNGSGLTATFYRHVAVGDDGTSSTSQARIQGTIGAVNADLNLSSVVLPNGGTQTIDYYSVALPTL